ncbi:MAG: S8 family serine peptidase [Candidatus Nitrosopolaris sp.]
MLYNGLIWIINNAARLKIKVVNLSIDLGSPSSHLEEAVALGVQKGITFVGAAGKNNQDSKFTWPGNDPNIIVVGAMTDSDGKCGGLGPSVTALTPDGPSQYVDRDDTYASYSNFGDNVDIVAPGTNINSTLPHNRYGIDSGTSMASPFVAGAAYQYILQHPAATPLNVRIALTHAPLITNTTAACDGDGHGFYTIPPSQYSGGNVPPSPGPPLLYAKSLHSP